MVFQMNFSIKHTFTDVKIYSLRRALNIFFLTQCGYKRNTLYLH